MFSLFFISSWLLFRWILSGFQTRSWCREVATRVGHNNLLTFPVGVLTFWSCRDGCFNHKFLFILYFGFDDFDWFLDVIDSYYKLIQIFPLVSTCDVERCCEAAIFWPGWTATTQKLLAQCLRPARFQGDVPRMSVITRILPRVARGKLRKSKKSTFHYSCKRSIWRFGHQHFRIFGVFL